MKSPIDDYLSTIQSSICSYNGVVIFLRGVSHAILSAHWILDTWLQLGLPANCGYSQQIKANRIEKLIKDVHSFVDK